MYLPHQFLRNLAPGGMSAAAQRAADEQVGRTAAAVSASWQRMAVRARAVVGWLPLVFRNQSGQHRRQQADALPPCVRAVPESVAKSQFNGHPVRSQLNGHTVR
jgi:hypothetical protein